MRSPGRNLLPEHLSMWCARQGPGIRTSSQVQLPLDQQNVAGIGEESGPGRVS